MYIAFVRYYPALNCTYEDNSEICCPEFSLIVESHAERAERLSMWRVSRTFRNFCRAITCLATYRARSPATNRQAGHLPRLPTHRPSPQRCPQLQPSKGSSSFAGMIALLRCAQFDYAPAIAKAPAAAASAPVLSATGAFLFLFPAKLPLASTAPSSGITFRAVNTYPSLPPLLVIIGCVRPGRTCQSRVRLV